MASLIRDYSAPRLDNKDMVVGDGKQGGGISYP